MSLFAELKRRNVFRVGIAYVVLSWLLLQVTDVVVPILTLPDWVAKLVLFLLLLGLPLVLFFAWAFELTPDGVRREKQVEPGQSITPRTGRKLDRAITVVLLIALGWFAWDRFAGHEERAEPVPVAGQANVEEAAQAAIDDGPPVVAVLPFKFTGSDDGGFLAEGLHDDLLTRLARLAAFRVISRTSMMEYANTTKNMRQIGQELGADFILEGGVQARGGQVRINAQLIDAPADEHLWADVYNRELTADNLFDVQAELAVAIAGAMQTTLTPADQAVVDDVPTRNMAAYNAYLRGLRLVGTPEGYVGTQADRDASTAFEEAVRLDPDFAVAWALLARTRTWSDCCPPPEEQEQPVLSAIERARILNPGMVESELAQAEYLYRFRNDYLGALETLEALGDRLARHPDALQLSAFLLRRLGRVQEGYEQLVAAQRLEPLAPQLQVHLISFAASLDRCELAANHVEALNSLAPQEPGSQVMTAHYELECNGDGQRAAAMLRDLDFNRTGGIDVGFDAAWSDRNVPMLLELIDSEPINPWAGIPAWRQLTRVLIQRYLKPDAARAEQSLARLSEILDDLEGHYDGEGHHGEIDENFVILKAYQASLSGDGPGTRQWVAEHERRLNERSNGDRYRDMEAHYNHAEVFTLAGLHDEAIEELRVMLETPGGHRFPCVELQPAFDALRDHPGYLALKDRYGR